MWNSLEVAKLIADLLIPLLVVILGFVFNRRLKEIEQQNQSRIQQYEEEQQQMRDEIERRHKPHIEFAIDCNFFGPHDGWYIAEIIISAKNVSVVRHEFKEINLRIRGIKTGEALDLWEGHGDRLEFRHKVLETGIVPDNWNFIFVEPGVRQEISFVTRIEENYRYIVARAEFRYDSFNPHSIERMFEVDRQTTAESALEQ